MCMKRACAGEEDFRILIESNIYYIDKSKILASLADESLKKLKANSNDILHHEGSVAAICWGTAFSHISCQAKCDAKEMALLPIA